MKSSGSLAVEVLQAFVERLAKLLVANSNGGVSSVRNRYNFLASILFADFETRF